MTFVLYLMIILVNGNWCPWKPYVICTKTCGRGFRRRTRFCGCPRASSGGALCSGPSMQAAPCVVKQCPGRTISSFSIVAGA